MQAPPPPHPIDELRAARRDLLAALQGCTASDLLRPAVEGDCCGRDVLLHMAAWLRELACLVPDLATHGYQRAAPCDPRPDWAARHAAQLTLPRTMRPEAAVAAVVTAHARLLDAVAGLDDAGLRRRGPTVSALRRAGGICSWPRPRMSGNTPRTSRPARAGARAGRRPAHAVQAQGYAPARGDRRLADHGGRPHFLPQDHDPSHRHQP